MAALVNDSAQMEATDIPISLGNLFLFILIQQGYVTPPAASQEFWSNN